MAIRLVVTDLDGTFLGTDKTISDRAVETVRRLEAEGILFTFITGRPWCAAQRYAERAGIVHPTITCNGAVINDGYRMLWRKAIPLSALRPVLEQAGAMGLTVLYSQEGREDAMYDTHWVQVREDYQVHLPTEDEWERLAADKVNIMSDGLDEAFRALRPRMEALTDTAQIVFYGDSGCEIVAKGLTKATALRQYAQEQGIPLEEVMAVGDNANDLEMLREAGVGVAVANATDEAKAAADYICQHSNTDGVLEAIERFCWGGNRE